MRGGFEWAAWLVARRAEIERGLRARLGTPLDAGSVESEALRRFRSFAGSALGRGGAAAPALDGLRLEGARFGRLLDAWLAAAEAAAGAGGVELRAQLAPLAERFREALRDQRAARRARAAPRVSRRVVLAAIDRIGDAYLAVDVDSGRIVDANPAASALLGVQREVLLGCDVPRFLDDSAREPWESHLEALAESPEPRRFRALLRDVHGLPVPVDVNATRYARRESTLALVVARPSAGGAWPA